MDMVGTPYAPAELWALTPDGRSNFVVDEAYDAADRVGFTGLQNCKLGQSDHQAFFDVGIPSALFIWLDYHYPVAPATCESISQGSYTTEPEYHRPTDGMNNVSPERLQSTLDVVGGAFAHNALNSVEVTATRGGLPTADGELTANCGDGLREIGDLDASGTVTAVFPHATCDLRVVDGPYVSLLRDVAIAGDTAVEFGSFKRNTPSAECDFERGSAAQSRARFEDQYAANHNGRNAFGQCVSQKSGG